MTMKTLGLFITLFLFTSICAFPVAWGNGVSHAYTGGDGTSSDSSKSTLAAAPMMEVLIIEGAGYFLNSHADFQRFLSKYELAEIHSADFAEWQTILNSSIDRIKSANDTYYSLKSIAAGTPYNQNVIAKLKKFNYPDFSTGKGFNARVFHSVSEFLTRGDVTGTYNKIYLDMTIILENLKNIKNDIDQNIYPDISKLWELNQNFSNSLLFGQYLAMIFKGIL